MLGEELDASLRTGNPSYLCKSEDLSPLTLTSTFPDPVGLNADSSGDSFLFFMDYKSGCPPSPPHGYRHGHMASGGRGHVAAALQQQLLSYSENAENEGEEVEYLEEEELQVRTSTPAPTPTGHTPLLLW